MTDFQRMAALLASGVLGAMTTYDLPAALGKGRVILVAAEPGLLIALRHLWYQQERPLRIPPESSKSETVLVIELRLGYHTKVPTLP